MRTGEEHGPRREEWAGGPTGQALFYLAASGFHHIRESRKNQGWLVLTYSEQRAYLRNEEGRGHEDGGCPIWPSGWTGLPGEVNGVDCSRVRGRATNISEKTNAALARARKDTTLS